MNNTIKKLSSYLPQDRQRALSSGQNLPDPVYGAALFADITGFTSLTEKLTQQFGARRGIEELSGRINTVYDALIQIIEQYGGSVIGFAGDAITGWFGSQSENPSLSAVIAALEMQAALRLNGEISIKVAVTSGTARRFVLGDPEFQLFDALAGDPIARLAVAGHLLNSGEVLADEATLKACGEALRVSERRSMGETGEKYAVIAACSKTLERMHITAGPDELSPELLRAWVPPEVYAQEQSGLGEFLTELRPAVALFLRFEGIDYDGDESAGLKLDDLIRRVQHVLARLEGTLVQFTTGDKGDYLYLCFGAPTAHEDDARRAVRAAMELRQTLAELPFLEPVQMGISRGILRVGAFGGATRRTYSAMGDDVNIAARLMSAALPGEILLSGRVQLVLGEQFTLEPRPPLPLKGKAEPLPVFAVTGRQHRRATRLLEPAYRLPMIGRQAELRLVADRLELARQGKGQAIGITAEAGMGKSRLLAEVIRLAQRKGFACYGGACESSGASTPYLAWKAIWQAFFDVDPAASSRRQLRHLEDEIEDRAPDRLQAMPLLASLLDLPMEENDFTRTLEPKDRRNVLKALLEDCLLAAVKEEPVLFVLEDAHWIDALSYDLLETLARAMANSAVCFVLAYRPPELERSKALRLETFSNLTEIVLDELAAADSEQLIRAKLAQLFPERQGGMPKALVKPLTDLAQGNPFFLEELLNYLRDRGISPYDEQAISALELPSSLHTLILSRMDQLTETQKVTLKVASIIGRLFPFAWLHGYYPALGAPEAVKADLNELSRLELTPREAPEPELTYLFKHIVTHEVAYENLAHATRLQLHEQLAQYLEAHDADRQLDLLAFHYGRSGNLTKQREYYRKAGEAAQAAYANTAAIDYYERLLDLLPAGDRERVEVCLELGRVLQLIGQWAEAENRFREALHEAENLREETLIAQSEVEFAELMNNREKFTDALPVLERARTRFAEAGDRLELSKVLAIIANVHFQLAKGREIDLGPARAMAEESVALARELDGNRLVLARALNTLASIAMFQEDRALEQAVFEESLAIRREAGDRRGIANSLYNMSVRAFRRSELEGTQPWIEESLSLYRQLGDKFGQTWPRLNLGVLAISRGEYSTARAYFEENIAFFSEQGSRGRLMAANLMGLGTVAYLETDFAAARGSFEQALENYRSSGEQYMIPIMLQDLAITSLEQGDAAQASQLFSKAMALVKKGRDWWLPEISGLVVAARLAQARNEFLRSARLCGAVDGLISVYKPEHWGTNLESHIYAQIVDMLKRQLAPDQLSKAWAEGKGMGLDEALQLAREAVGTTT